VEEELLLFMTIPDFYLLDLEEGVEEEELLYFIDFVMVEEASITAHLTISFLMIQLSHSFHFPSTLTHLLNSSFSCLMVQVHQYFAHHRIGLPMGPSKSTPCLLYEAIF